MTLAEFLDSLQTTWPVRMVQGAVQGAMAPGNAFASSWGNPVTTEQMVAPAANLAGLAVGLPGGAGGLGSGLRAAKPGFIRFYRGEGAVPQTYNLNSLLGASDAGRNAALSGAAREAPRFDNPSYADLWYKNYDLAKKNAPKTSTDERSGLWFTTRPDVAARYGPNVYYVDVPASSISKHVAEDPLNIDQFILSKEMAAKKKPLK